MTRQPIWCCGMDSSIREAAEMMGRHNVGCVLVCDERGKLSGIVTDRDICCQIVAKGGSCDAPVSDIASRNMVCASPDTGLDEIEKMMRANKVRRIPVVGPDKRVQGIISLSDMAHHCGTVQEEHEVMEVFETVTMP